MPKAYDLKKRYIRLGGPETTVAMERVYWNSIDTVARTKNVPWRDVVKDLVDDRPPDYKGSRIAWIRFAAMQLFVIAVTRRTIDTATDTVASEPTTDEEEQQPTGATDAATEFTAPKTTKDLESEKHMETADAATDAVASEPTTVDESLQPMRAADPATDALAPEKANKDEVLQPTAN